MRAPPDIRARLIKIGTLADEDIDIAEAAFILAAAERPGVALDPYRRHLDHLVADVRVYVGGTEPAVALDLRIEALEQVIVKHYGYGGTEAVFDDLDAANLMRVIDNRQGLPIVISILFIHTARWLGWPISGLDFPGRFLVRMEFEGERKILDPFGGGRVLEAQDMREMFKAVTGAHAELTPKHYRDVGNRDILLRLQGNIKTWLLHGERPEDAIDVLETMLLFAPHQAELWREKGMLHARLDDIKDAVQALEEYLRRSGGAGPLYNTSVLLQELRARLN